MECSPVLCRVYRRVVEVSACYTPIPTPFCMHVAASMSLELSVACERVPVTSTEELSIEATGLMEEGKSTWRESRMVVVNWSGGDMGGNSIRDCLLKEIGLTLYVISMGEVGGVGFDEGMDVGTVGIPVSAGIDLD